MPCGQSKADYRAECLTAGHYDLLVAEYADPLTVYLPGEPPMIATPQTVRAFFRALRGGLELQGMTRMTGRVTAEGLPIRGRARLWTDWYGEAPGRAPELVAQTVCYRRVDGADDRTEMLEFTRLDLPMPAAA
ncbi:MAG: hypothetical protein KF887_07225 [Paracoccaceae bacterium]|nr:MAG: hypothetical protein KF887_07225 [Paracoccaceae bacterium]